MDNAELVSHNCHVQGEMMVEAGKPCNWCSQLDDLRKKMIVSTTNFHPCTDLKLLCTCGHPDCDERSVDQETLYQIQLVREDLGQPMTIMSGGRCPNHPDERTKSKPGDHQRQKAVDVACNDEQTETKLKVLAGRHGATRVAGGACCGFVHMAWTETERTDVPTWGY